MPFDGSPEEWGEQYRDCRQHKVAFTEDLRRLIAHLLESEEIDAQLEYRTKEIDSFVDKIRRKNEKYTDPLAEITDLCGLRVICTYQDDVRRVNELIEREFAIDWENSIRYGSDSDPERFSYRSDQYVVSISDGRQSLPEWKKFGDAPAEIQVRTIMQHAWAAVDHKIRYKASDLPNSVRRRLYRLSALLETADDQFSAVREESQQVEADYRKSIDAEDLDVSIDALSLREYLDATDASTIWVERAIALGYKAPVEWPSEPDPEAIKAYLADEDFGRVLQALKFAKRETLMDVRDLLKRAETWGGPLLKRIKKESEARDFTPYAVPKDLLTFFVLYDLGVLATLKEFHYRSEVIAGLQDAIRAK